MCHIVLNRDLPPPTWAITNELVFYLLISLGISKNIVGTIFWVIVSILYYIITYSLYDIETFRYSAIPAASLPFSIGALLFHLNKKGWLPNGGLVTFSILLIAFYLNAYFRINTNIFTADLHLYLNILLAVSIIHVLFHQKDDRFRKWDKFIGYYSYPIYLFHFQFAIIYYYLFRLEFSTFKIPLIQAPIFLILLVLVLTPLVILVDKRIDDLKSRIKFRSKNE